MTTAGVAQEIDWWKGDFASALQQAQAAPGKPVLLYFWSEGDEVCKAMFGETMSDKAVIQAAADYVCLGCKQQEAQGKAVFDQFHIRQVPTVMIVSADGGIVDALAGYRAARPFLEELQRIARGEGTVAALRKSAEGSKDAALQLRLALKLRAIGQHDEAGQLLAAIVEGDPKLKSAAAAEAELLQLIESAFGGGAAPGDIDLGPIERLVTKVRHDRVRFLGYDRIAAVEYARGNLSDAIKAVAKAFKHVPDDEVLDWGRTIAGKAYVEREQLDKRALKLALDITTATLEAAEKVQAERGDEFLADVLYQHAAIQIASGKRKPGFASMERAIELDPDNENLKKALEAYRNGAK